jgi:hypothetical protein
MEKAYSGSKKLWGFCFCLIAALCLQNARASQPLQADISALAEPAVTEQGSIPTTPPDAAKIIVAEPDVEGYADVQGLAGAVPGLSTVAVINLDTNSIMTTTATLNGAFSCQPLCALRFVPAGQV